MHCTRETVNDAIDMGFRFCAIDSDASFMASGASAALDLVKGWKASRATAGRGETSVE
jgi:hypothetical protein